MGNDLMLPVMQIKLSEGTETQTETKNKIFTVVRDLYCGKRPQHGFCRSSLFGMC